MANTNLSAAKKAKNDEFYTQYEDIQKEIEAYLEYDKDTFRNKVVYCNCDDPFESNFFRYFAMNFKRLGLKRLITTSYKPSPVANTQLGLFGDDKTIQPEKGRPKVTANKFIINDVADFDGDGEFNLTDVAEQLKANKNNEWSPLKGDGDFRSDECIELLKQSDIVVTNPPFSLFREYIKQLFNNKKTFLVIGSMNAITYKEIFPLIKEDKMWLGNKTSSQQMFLEAPMPYTKQVMASKPQGMWWRIVDGKPLIGVHTALWFTNLEHGRRHQPLNLMTMEDNLKFNQKMVKKGGYMMYDNYHAIEIPYTDSIPSNYSGIMAVPISFLDKYSPEQFEILGITQRNDDPYKIKKYTAQQYSNANDLNARGVIMVNGKPKSMFARILIKHRKTAK